ncbi:MAG: CsbD family protein [Peptostreptococcus anaerobius]
MSEEKLKSKIEQASGVLKEGTGKLTGDKELEAKGFVEKTRYENYLLLFEEIKKRRQTW